MEYSPIHKLIITTSHFRAVKLLDEYKVRIGLFKVSLFGRAVGYEL